MFVAQEEQDGGVKQWPAARLTRSATLPRKSRAAVSGSSAGSAGVRHAQDKAPAAKKAYPSSGSSGYNSLPRMHGGGRKSGGVKNSPSSELSYGTAVAAAKSAAARDDSGKPESPPSGGRGSNFDSSYSCDEISVNDSSVALTVQAAPSPPAKAKTAADLRREYFRGLGKYGQPTASNGPCGAATAAAAGEHRGLQHHRQQYFEGAGRDRQPPATIASGLHKYFDNACKIK